MREDRPALSPKSGQFTCNLVWQQFGVGGSKIPPDMALDRGTCSGQRNPEPNLQRCRIQNNDPEGQAHHIWPLWHHFGISPTSVEAPQILGTWTLSVMHFSDWLVSSSRTHLGSHITPIRTLDRQRVPSFHVRLGVCDLGGACRKRKDKGKGASDGGRQPLMPQSAQKWNACSSFTANCNCVWPAVYRQTSVLGEIS